MSGLPGDEDYDYADEITDPEELLRIAKARLARALHAEKLWRQIHVASVRTRDVNTAMLDALRRIHCVVRDDERWDAGLRDEIAGIVEGVLGCDVSQ